MNNAYTDAVEFWFVCVENESPRDGLEACTVTGFGREEGVHFEDEFIEVGEEGVAFGVDLLASL